ncbi:isoeugenol synthase 1-like [Durio zibethinus]|uniref:Isoeugenol synthase 1-like n=1 Tax=Durio zibethinus TaxID=66656 RepID=A0A6P5XA92_DURZI|nr:isoeugenol synthase 1-like [Durio zibethinus]
MAMGGEKSKILIFAATGYLGKYMVKASVALGHPTYAYTRPLSHNNSSSKLDLLKDFESMGVTIFYGELDEHEKLVSVLQQVEVVISTLAVPQHLDQLKIISAMKDAGTIKRFVPSEYGNEVDRITSALPPFEALLANKRKIRRAAEAAGLPYTYVAANTFLVYFIDYLLHPHEKPNELVVYGTGQVKVVFNYEEDIAAYTVKAATDPRVANRVIIYRPPANVTTQLELISAWEEKTSRTFKRVHVPEEEIIKLSETLPFPDNIPVAVLHNIFIKGDQMTYELMEEDLEASKLYPDYSYTTIDKYLDMCVANPPRPKLTAFA